MKIHRDQGLTLKNNTDIVFLSQINPCSPPCKACSFGGVFHAIMRIY